MPRDFMQRMLVGVLCVVGCADSPDSGLDPVVPGDVAESDEDALQANESTLWSADAGARRCGGPLGLRCASSEYCAIPSDGGCPGAKDFGTCQPRVRFCPQNFDPVCGCDGKTYSNACSAAAAGASVQYAGECVATDTSCGGFVGVACPGKGTCIDDPRDDCDPEAGGADCGGVCQCREPHSCPAGARFDRRPSVCACVRDVALCPSSPCAYTDCATGSRCVERDCKAVCEPVAGCQPCLQGIFCTEACVPGPAITN